MPDDKQIYINQFLTDEISMFFIITIDKEPASISFQDIVQRKVDENKISILCWPDKDEANHFLINKLRGQEHMKTIEMDINQFRDFINRIDFDKENILLEAL